mgnify:CR=1 FL=1
MRRLIIPFMVLLAGCDNEPELICQDLTPDTVEECVTEINVTNDECIILESRHKSGLYKYVYHHDGTNYDTVKSYSSVDGEFELNKIYSLEYNSNGLFSKVDQENEDGSIFTFHFTYDEPEMTIRYIIRDSENSVIQDYTTPYLYLPNVPDTLYYIDYTAMWPGTSDKFILVEEFLAGNSVRGYQYDENGTCEFQGEMFSLNTRSYYDNRPNVYTPEVILGLTLESNIYIDFNRNNQIGYAFGDESTASSTCLNLLTNGSGDYWLKSTESVEFIYDCE